MFCLSKFMPITEKLKNAIIKKLKLTKKIIELMKWAI